MVQDDRGCPILAGIINLGNNAISRRRLGLMFLRVEERSKVPWRITSMIEDITSPAVTFQNISWGHVFRETNFLGNAFTNVMINSSIYVFVRPNLYFSIVLLTVVFGTFPLTNFLVSIKKKKKTKEKKKKKCLDKIKNKKN